MQLAEERFDRAMENLGEEYQDYNDECKSIYLNTMEECCKEIVKNIKDKKEELNILTCLLEDYQNKAHSVIEASKRAEEEKNQKAFYSVIIPNIDLEEINKLKEVGKHIRQQDLLNKIIWKGYYEKPTQLMCGRVVGSSIKTGIYKITNRENNMSYIGQSTDIASRWKQHIKRGLGAETPTRNKLYPAMYTTGVENFTFEILAECSPKELNQMEKYFIDFYETNSYGYNGTQGNN